MKRLIIAVILLTELVICAGCTAMLEGETQSTSLHVAVSNERPPEEQIEVSGYEELQEAILDLIMEHETDGMMVVYSYDGNVQSDVNRAIDAIMKDDPIAIYAVAKIEGTVTRIVSHFEISVGVEYKRTREQVDSIVNVSTLRYLRTELLSIMSDYRDEAVFLVTLQVTDEDMAGLVRETYYQNPRNIVMLPITVVETITISGDERYIELRLGNIEQAGMLRQFGTRLTGSVRLNALAAEGENDAEILLSLVGNLIGACNYDERTARTISEHGVQNITATAYGALVIGNAVGEGFAMAFKALCDELGFDCRVVLGSFDGMIHAWNIVSLYGDYYHIDPAMCAMNGVETAFLKTDTDIIRDYSWDRENTVKCNGRLTYEDIVPGEEEPDDNEDEDGDNDEDEGNDEDNDENDDEITDDDTENEDGEPSEPPDETEAGAPDITEQTGGDTP